jgi:magnesium-transporting ATPase (P-type)
VPVEKAPEPVARTRRSAIARSDGLLGHAGRRRRGTGVVVGTGERTEIGRISALVQRVEKLTTPLLQQMEVFAQG